MASSFHSLYLPSVDRDTLIATLRESLSSLGYTAFDPFALIPGKSYAQAVRLFVSPVVDSWLRVTGELDENLLPMISQNVLCLSISLSSADATIAVYADGARVEDPNAIVNALVPHLNSRSSADELRSILTENTANLRIHKDESLPIDALSGDLQSLAGQVDMKQANSMFARLSGQLMKKAGGDKNEAADLLKSGADWDSAGGRRIRALMTCLTVPDNWRTPDFVSLRDAYQLHIRRQRLPNARLYPGDAETMAQVPNALDFTPIYAGRDVS
jgi:hypothetical protein